MPSSDKTRLRSLSIMISLQKVSSVKLELEEDCCGKMPATRRFTPVTIVTIVVLVGEAANMMTFDYGMVGAGKACRNNGSLENLGWRNHRWL